VLNSYSLSIGVDLDGAKINAALPNSNVSTLYRQFRPTSGENGADSVRAPASPVVAPSFKLIMDKPSDWAGVIGVAPARGVYNGRKGRAV